MNELKRSAKRTREQLTFSDTYLVLDNLREYDFDLVSFYVTFNQYIDRRNYEGKAENSLIFANNESLFKAFNVSKNRFYRLLRLAYECGLIDIEKGHNNKNIYILNDAVPFQPLNKIRDWKDRNSKNKREVTKDENIKTDDEEIETEDENIKSEDIRIKAVKSYPKKGQPKSGQVVVPKKSNQLSPISPTGYPEKGQPNLSENSIDSSVNTALNSSNVFNSSKDFNISKSINQSIDSYSKNNANSNYDNNNFLKNKANEIHNMTDQQDCYNQQMENFYYLLNKCEVHLIDDTYKDAVIHALKLLIWDIENKKIMKIGGNTVPTDLVREDMEKLDFLVIDHAIAKFKKATGEREIRNTVAYLKVCIYNAIHEIKLDVENQVNSSIRDNNSCLIRKI